MELDNVKLTPSKGSLKAKAAAIYDQIEAGEQNKLQVFLEVKCLEEMLVNLKEYLREGAESELTKYGKEGYKVQGAKCEIRNGGAIYDYSHDSEWAHLQSELNRINEAIKARESFLKALPSEMADPVSGEIVSPAKLVSHKKDSIVITLAK